MLKCFLAFFTKYESLAVWLEGIALVLILGLDFKEYRRQGKERKREAAERELQHAETLRQLSAMEKQAKAAVDSVALSQQQAEMATENLRIVRAQLLDEQHRELLRAISILDEIRLQARYWSDISDRKWGAVNEASAILPEDSHVVLVQAGRHSRELRKEVRETFRMVVEADRGIAQFYGQQMAYRQERLMQEAHANLVAAEPKLAQIARIFEESDRLGGAAGGAGQ